MSKALFATKTIQAIIISGSNSSFSDERRNGIISMVNGDPRIKNDPAVAQYGEALQIEGVRNPYINMASDVFDHSFFIITLKNTLLIILGALSVVFFALIAESLLGKQQRIRETVQEPLHDELDNNENTIDFDEDIDFEVSSANGEIDAVAEEDRSAMNAHSPSHDDFDVPNEEASSDSELLDEPCSGPQGLYSPHGNISWEVYTKERLASELHRCAASEQDMIFIVMEFRESTVSNEDFFNEFAEMAVNFFVHRDMIFEWKEDGISIIVPNVDVDQGVARCEDFHNRVKTKLLQASSLEKELCIGLSSRAGRLIDPDRLMFEASKAVERALVDPVSPIIAFKSDPEKYRAFIAAQSSEK
jgi:hypothetical protein